MIVLPSFAAPHKTIFLISDFQSWCISRIRVFANSIENNLAIYIQSLYCLKYLLKYTKFLVIDYVDLNNNPLMIIKQLSVFFDTKIEYEDLKEVFQEDSQAGTRLARDKVKRDVTPEEIKSINDIWREKAPNALLIELNLSK
jgi:hypothetical protein